MSDDSSELLGAATRVAFEVGQAAVHLECFGYALAAKVGYRSLRGMDAVHFYLVNKHGWLPSVVRDLTIEDKVFLLKEEMVGWVLPGEDVDTIQKTLRDVVAKQST